MTKKLKIYNYRKEPVEIKIKDFNKLTSPVVLKVISEDEILIVNYPDGKEVIFDSFPNGRVQGYDDGWVFVPLELIDKISEISDSYSALEFFGDKDAKLRTGIQSLFDLSDMIGGSY